MSGYFETLAFRAAGLAPPGWPRVAPRIVPRLAEATAASADDGPAAGPPAGGEGATPWAGEDAGARMRAERPPGVEPPARPSAAGDIAGRPAWMAPARRVVAAELPARSADEPSRTAAPGRPAQEPFPGPRDPNPAAVSVLRIQAPRPVAAGPTGRPSQMDPRADAPRAASEDSARGPTSMARSVDAGRIGPRHDAPSPGSAAEEGSRPGGRPPVSVTIGRIEVTVEPPPPAAASLPERSRGFAAYARARRGHLR